MRLGFLRVLFVGLFLFLGAHLFFTQVINGDRYLTLSDGNRIRLLPVPALRGTLFDAYGVLLATNRPSYDISIIPKDFDRNAGTSLLRTLRVTQKELDRALDRQKQTPLEPVLIKEDASMEEVFQLKEIQPEVDGLQVDIHGRRFYPLGAAAAHITGYIGMITQEEYREGDRMRFLYSDFIGRSGIERTYDDFLRGYHGGRQVEVNARGRILRVLSEKRPERGQDLYLTLDAELQSAIYELIKDRHATVALMDLENEGVLAVVSSPSYDPNAFVMPRRSDERMGYLSSEDRPLVDRAMRAGFPLGSIFKLVVALGGLQEGVITAQTEIRCAGSFVLKPGQRPFKCWRPSGHGPMNLTHAIEQSCNVYFYEVGKRLGADRIARYARELGFGAGWDIALGNMNPGLVPDQAWKRAELGEKWYQGETISFAIGQSYLLVNPLQVLRMVSTIAKDGTLTYPHVIEEEKMPVGRQPIFLLPRSRKIHVDATHIQTLKKAMQQVVASRSGTGQLARIEGLSVAGKTATAQTPHGDDHSWFTGFAPLEHPRIAFVVFIAHGGSGGQHAAPLGREVLELWKTLEEKRAHTEVKSEAGGGRAQAV